MIFTVFLYDIYISYHKNVRQVKIKMFKNHQTLTINARDDDVMLLFYGGCKLLLFS